MLSRFKSLLKPPVLADPEKNSQARNIHTLLLATMVLTMLFLAFALYFDLSGKSKGQAIVAGIALLIEFGLLILVQRGSIRLTSIIYTTFLWAAVIGIVGVFYGGVRDTGFAAAALIIVIASLTMGVGAGGIYTAMTIVAGIILWWLETIGKLPPRTPGPLWEALLSYCITFIGIALLLRLALHSITTLAHEAVTDDEKQKEINALLEASQVELKERASSLERRNIALQLVANITKFTSQAKSEKELLEQTAQWLAGDLALDFVNVFLLDEAEENAILQVSSNARGIIPSEKKWLLRVVRSEAGYAFLEADTLHYQVGMQTYYVEPPASLFETTVNMSFPLIAGQRLLGLINLQTASLDTQLVEQPTLQTLADQVALSIENIRLVKQLENQLKEINILAGENIKSGWEQLRKGKLIGFSYDRLQVLPADEIFPPEITVQLAAGKSVSYNSTGTSPASKLVAPILLRDNVIGLIGYDNNDPQHEWGEDEKTMLESIASRVSLSLENTRLVADAQSRAERERTLGQVATRMRETLDIETILKTAASELRQSLQLNEAEVRLQLAEQPKKLDKNK